MNSSPRIEFQRVAPWLAVAAREGSARPRRTACMSGVRGGPPRWLAARRRPRRTTPPAPADRVRPDAAAGRVHRWASSFNIERLAGKKSPRRSIGEIQVPFTKVTKRLAPRLRRLKEHDSHSRTKVRLLPKATTLGPDSSPKRICSSRRSKGRALPP